MTQKRPRLWAFLGCVGVSLVLAGCGGQADPGAGGAPAAATRSGRGGPIKLLFVSNSNSDWWNAVEKGMQDGGREFGVEVELKRNNKQTQGQIDLLQQAMALDVQGVAVSVIEAEAPGVADAMGDLKQSGKVVIAIDSDIAPESAGMRRAYIGTNNVNAGIAAGKAAAAIRPKGGKVAIFVGTSAAANARERKQGFFQGAGPAFKEVETFDDGGDQSKARDNVQTALSKYPDLDVLLGLWSYNAPAIAEEVGKLPEVRKRTTVVTFDLDQSAVAQLDENHIDASVCQNPYEMGYQGVRLLKALIEHDDAMVAQVLPDGKSRDTGVRIIVPSSSSPVQGDNVISIGDMKKWLLSKGLRSS